MRAAYFIYQSYKVNFVWLISLYNNSLTKEKQLESCQATKCFRDSQKTKGPLASMTHLTVFKMFDELKKRLTNVASYSLGAVVWGYACGWRPQEGGFHWPGLYTNVWILKFLKFFMLNPTNFCLLKVLYLVSCIMTNSIKSH